MSGRWKTPKQHPVVHVQVVRYFNKSLNAENDRNMSPTGQGPSKLALDALKAASCLEYSLLPAKGGLLTGHATLKGQYTNQEDA